MTGRPTILVELDDGTGTFPHNITAYVDLTEGYSITRGRTDRFESIQPSTLSMTLDNTKGLFTPGPVILETYAEQMIRVTETVGATTSIRFTGYVSEWPVEWPNGMSKMSIVRITAVDRLPRLARRTLRSMIEEEYYRDDMLAYYTFGDSSEVHKAADATGNNGSLVAHETQQGDLEFGATKPDFGYVGYSSNNELTEINFHDNNGAYLSGSVNGLTGGDLRIELLVSSYHVSIQQLFYISFGGSVLYAYTRYVTTGPSSQDVYLNVERLTGSTSHSIITAKLTPLVDQHIAITETGGIRRLVIDGVSRDTDTDTMPAGTYTADVSVGATASAALTQMGHFVIATRSSLVVSSIAAHSNVTRTGFSGDTSTARVGRILDYIGFPASDRSFLTGSQSVPAFPTAGSSVLDVIEALMVAERGLAFIRGDGKLRIQNRGLRNTNATSGSTLIVTGDQIDGDVSFVLDMQQVRNYVTATRLRYGVAQTVQDAASIAVHDRYEDEYSDLAVMNDFDAKLHASALVAKFANPIPRMPNVGLDALSLPSAVQQDILDLEISSRMHVTGLPAQAPVGDADLLVEGWTETVSASEWRLVLNTSAASIEQ